MTIKWHYIAIWKWANISNKIRTENCVEVDRVDPKGNNKKLRHTWI